MTLIKIIAFSEGKMITSKEPEPKNTRKVINNSKSFFLKIPEDLIPPYKNERLNIIIPGNKEPASIKNGGVQKTKILSIKSRPGSEGLL
jgi:hypothetical protein